MQTKLPGGYVMVCGGCAKDAELQYVGDDDKRLCKVGLAVGRQPDPEGGDRPKTVWANVVAWHGLASVLSLAKKGDPVLVIGTLKSREYEGKTYTDLVADWLWVSSVHSTVESLSSAPSSAEDVPFKDLSGDDGDLPF